jgi:hypothetical protein
VLPELAPHLIHRGDALTVTSLTERHPPVSPPIGTSTHNEEVEEVTDMNKATGKVLVRKLRENETTKKTTPFPAHY